MSVLVTFTCSAFLGRVSEHFCAEKEFHKSFQVERPWHGGKSEVLDGVGMFPLRDNPKWVTFFQVLARPLFQTCLFSSWPDVLTFFYVVTVLQFP